MEKSVSKLSLLQFNFQWTLSTWGRLILGAKRHGACSVVKRCFNLVCHYNEKTFKHYCCTVLQLDATNVKNDPRDTLPVVPGYPENGLNYGILSAPLPLCVFNYQYHTCLYEVLKTPYSQK